MGVRELRQRLALDLREIRGDPVGEAGGEEGNWSGEGRSLGTPPL